MKIIKRIVLYILTFLLSLFPFSSGGGQSATDFPKAAKEAATLLLPRLSEQVV